MTLARNPLTLIAIPLALVACLAACQAAPPPPSAATQAPPSTQPTSPDTARTAATGAPKNLFHQFGSLKQRAEGGDAVAQRLLAQLYLECAYIYDHSVTLNALELDSIPADSAEAMVINANRDRAQDCAQVDGGARVTQKDAEHWYEKAAGNGDLAAWAIVNMLRHPPLNSDEAQRFLEDVMASKDPVAVFAYGNVMGGPLTENLGETYAPLVSNANSLAWMLAGCRMGMDCGPESVLVSNLCLQQHVCGKGDYEQAMKSLMESQADREALDQQIENVLRAVTT